MLRKTIAALAITFALGGSSLPASAAAPASAFGGERIASGGNAHHNDRGNAHHDDRVSNLHRGLLPSRGRSYQWGPWGHWGSYYGPMI